MSPAETVLTRVRHFAQLQPSATAIQSGHQRYTYADLDRRSTAIASWLRDRGVGCDPAQEDVVAIHATRSADLPIAMLGVWKARAAFLILDQSYPPEALRARAAQCRIRSWLDLDTVFPDPSPSAPLADPDPDPDSLAYIAFTSGTTGTPRGIEGPHRPVTHFLDWYSSKFTITSADRFALLSGLAHDPLLRDIFAPWWNGATLCVPPDGAIKDPAQLAAFLDDHRVSVIHVTPSLARVIAAADRRLDSLRYIFFGGERLTYGLPAT